MQKEAYRILLTIEQHLKSANAERGIPHIVLSWTWTALEISKWSHAKGLKFFYVHKIKSNKITTFWCKSSIYNFFKVVYASKQALKPLVLLMFFSLDWSIEEGFIQKPRKAVVLAFWGKMATHMLLLRLKAGRVKIVGGYIICI